MLRIVRERCRTEDAGLVNDQHPRVRMTRQTDRRVFQLVVPGVARQVRLSLAGGGNASTPLPQ
jgi:hypothetical protein